MDVYRTLFEFAKTLLAEEQYDRLPSLLLERVAAATQAAKGLIVVRQGQDFVEKYNLRFERAKLSEQKRRFSRGLVREALAAGQLIFSRDIADDPRFMQNRSVQDLGSVSVIAAPLQYRDHIYAVIYLEKDSDCGSFSDLEREFLHQFAEMAGLSLHIALERKAFKDLSSGESPALFNQFDFGGIVGRHPNMLSLLELVGQVADSDAGVLIHGETGTGKELIARAVYRNSPRRDKPFVTIHCGALPENLFESELFGHRKGAFTGAMRDRAGRIAQAAGGTLFIDEVAEIPLAVQAKLLRFFQFGEFQRVGSDRAEQVDLRIISATHRDIPTMIKEGTFREDLYYRLKVVELKIPPLRERRSDIPLLAASFLKKYWKREGEPHLTEAAMHALGGYHFPGNVRELDHLIERVCLLTKSAEIDLGELPEEVVAGEAAAMPATLTNEWLKDARFQASRQAADEVEKRFLKTLLQHHDGNIAAAAEAAGMQKTYLYKLLNRHDLR